MSMRTQLAGAYRRAHDGQPGPDVETYTFTAGDVLLGQEGWQLRSMSESAGETCVVQASGRWDHPMHRGSWHRIVAERIELDVRPRDGEPVRVDVEHREKDVAISCGGTTRRHPVPTGTVLLHALHAGWGSVIDIVARATLGGDSTPVLPIDSSFAYDYAVHPSQNWCPGVIEVTAHRVGRAALETPDGVVRADEYAVVSSSDDCGPFRPGVRWYLGGDGLLAGYTDGDDMVWRAASAPSRA